MMPNRTLPLLHQVLNILAQLAEAVEYTNCISAEVGGNPPLNECPAYNTMIP